MSSAIRNILEFTFVKRGGVAGLVFYERINNGIIQRKSHPGLMTSRATNARMRSGDF